MSSSITSPSTTSPLVQTFTGVSKFASSLQSVLSRAEGIAQLPLNSLQAGLTTLQGQQSTLQSLDATFLSLQQSISSLQSAVTNNSLGTSVSDSSIASATVGAGATAGTYTLEVQDLGSYSTAISNPGASVVTDPTKAGISSDSSLTLTVGSTTTTITPASSSLSDLVTAINNQAGSQVQATLVNVGSTASPDYRISLRANNLGTDSIDLADSTGSLISTSTPGSLASYLVNGGSTPITSSSRTITLSPGLTVNLLGQSLSGHPVTISVTNNAAALESAFNGFVSAYNAAASALTQQHGSGTGAGALQGTSLVQQLGDVLSQLGAYSNGSPANSLSNFGITVDQTGQISINTATFTSAANANWSTLQTTLGSSTTSGFLYTATNLLSGLEDPTNGVVKKEETNISNSITAQQTKISDEQARLTTVQNNLTAEISKADATLAGLESQVTYVTGLFAAYNGSSSTSSNANNGLPTL